MALPHDDRHETDDLSRSWARLLEALCPNQLVGDGLFGSLQSLWVEHYLYYSQFADGST